MTALKILIVDDDHDNAASLGELFEMEGHAVKVVHSGQDAIDAYLTQHFDLAFMDVMMPGKNGVESFLEIRNMKPAARVFMMSGYSVEELMAQAVAGGALGFLDKPFDPAEVVRMTNEVGRGGLVLAATAASRAAYVIEDALLLRGVECALIQQPVDLKRIRTRDSVLVINAPQHLIDDVAFYRQIRSHGHEGAAIIVPDATLGQTPDGALLQDVGVTGILNKPFDPSELLQRLQQLAA